jgi:hypothetical protein
MCALKEYFVSQINAFKLSASLIFYYAVSSQRLIIPQSTWVSATVTKPRRLDGDSHITKLKSKRIRPSTAGLDF